MSRRKRPTKKGFISRVLTQMFGKRSARSYMKSRRKRGRRARPRLNRGKWARGRRVSKRKLRARKLRARRTARWRILEQRRRLRFPKRVYYVRKGLTRAAALRAVKRRDRQDYRGFKYDPKTGRAAIV